MKQNEILAKVLEEIQPDENEIKIIEEKLSIFIKKLENALKTKGVQAEVFVGGSFAKKTAIKKSAYDIDVFIRFDSKYKDEEISELTKKALGKICEFFSVKGSREYFKVKFFNNAFLEIVPVIKISNPKQARNITDLSYLHVKYIKSKIKNQKTLDEIKIAKAFCHANNCYGAESYINGFSGYALELLIVYYKSFANFVKAVAKYKEGEKIVLDIEKHFRNKQEVLMNLNSSKLQSPIVLIDPTSKERNALAALSEETFLKFKKACKEFLKNPSLRAFENKKTDLEKIKELANKNKNEFVLVEVHTDKQEGDIAGSKLLKFYKHLSEQIEKQFKIKNKGFNYNDKKAARYFFVVSPREELLFNGPSVKDEKNYLLFRKKHKNILIKNQRVFAKEKTPMSLKVFLNSWIKQNKNHIAEMAVRDFEIIN